MYLLCTIPDSRFHGNDVGKGSIMYGSFDSSFRMTEMDSCFHGNDVKTWDGFKIGIICLRPVGGWRTALGRGMTTLKLRMSRIIYSLLPYSPFAIMSSSIVVSATVATLSDLFRLITFTPLVLRPSTFICFVPILIT